MVGRSASASVISIPGSVGVKATEISAPPGWALLQRQLIGAINMAAPLMLKKYTEPGGVPYYADAVDDLYELFYNWGLFYAIGGDDKMLDRALQQWNAITRFSDDNLVSRVHPRFTPQIHNEYYNSTEWHHQGEGNMLFYDFGVANPAISENVRRAKRFASMFMGQDPKVPNYDLRHRIFRSPVQTSLGPLLHATPEMAQMLLLGREWERNRYYGVRASLYPVFKDLEPGWHNEAKRKEEIVGWVDKIVLSGDVPQSMCATALITNAYLYTGEEKYRQWVLEYVDGWMDRMRRNDGIMPDNVGPMGKVGEHRGGQWWGGYYGWNSRFSLQMFHGLIVGAECALLLTGDFGYLALLRSQIELLMNNAITRDDGQLLLPHRYGPDGWEEFRPFRIVDLVHLWHASMDPGDYELIQRLREGDKKRDWNHVEACGEKNNQEGNSEYARFQFYDGDNPDWPDKIMRAELQYVLATLGSMRGDVRDVDTIIADNREPANPVVTKGLTQMTMGAPHSVYNGGLLRAMVRYFDPDGPRPGLPEDVAALVDVLKPERMGVQLVNVSRTKTRNLIVQAGAFGEHQFTELKYQEGSQGGLSRSSQEMDDLVREGRAVPPEAVYLVQQHARLPKEDMTRPERVVPVDSKYFAVELPPSTAIRLDIGMRRFVNRPSYAFPWHGNKIPVPFQ